MIKLGIGGDQIKGVNSLTVSRLLLRRSLPFDGSMWNENILALSSRGGSEGGATAGRRKAENLRGGNAMPILWEEEERLGDESSSKTGKNNKSIPANKRNRTKTAKKVEPKENGSNPSRTLQK